VYLIQTFLVARLPELPAAILSRDVDEFYDAVLLRNLDCQLDMIQVVLYTVPVIKSMWLTAPIVVYCPALHLLGIAGDALRPYYKNILIAGSFHGCTCFLLVANTHDEYDSYTAWCSQRNLWRTGLVIVSN
jgi:hypothetical protein